MTEPSHVWIFQTDSAGLEDWVYVAVEMEDEARLILAKQRPEEKVIAVKRIKNINHMANGEVRLVLDPHRISLMDD